MTNLALKYFKMETQIIENSKGKKGIFIPIEYWEEIKAIYPEIESLGENLHQWEKDFIDKRLEMIADNPTRIKPIGNLFTELKRKI